MIRKRFSLVGIVNFINLDCPQILLIGDFTNIFFKFCIYTYIHTYKQYKKVISICNQLFFGE